jgi:DNA-binding winged helix-turn-helix (wHTH) protein
MKIVFNSESNDLTNQILTHALSGKDGVEIIGTKSERPLFDQIGFDNSNAYVLESHHSWTQKAIDFIKKRNPNIPVIVLMIEEIDGKFEWPRGAEFYLFNPNYSINAIQIYESIFRAINSYQTNFSKLQKLTAKLKDEIIFGDFKYDPVRRDFRYGGKFIKKMSPKEGGVLEILSANFDTVVKKEIIMEKVWHNVDFYIGRSMDVYVTNLRNLFKNAGLPLAIKNIHNAGLILEYER